MIDRDQLRAAGLAQGLIAELLGWRPSSITRALDRGESREIEAIVTAWELMIPEQRDAWLAALGVSGERKRRGRPRKGEPKGVITL